MKPCSWCHINLMTGCCVAYLVFSVHSESRKILGSGSRGGGEWMRRRALRAGTRRFIRCFSWIPVTLRAVFLGHNLSTDTHEDRWKGRPLCQVWDRSQLVPSCACSVRLHRSRRTSAAPACRPTGAWSGRWRRRRAPASSTSAPEN